MSAGINFGRIWFDDDLVLLKIESSDGKSVFCNEVYVGHQNVDDLIAGLSTFRNHVHGGLFDIVLGSFGPEYASGAFHARLHFQSPAKLLVTVRSQSEFQEFGIKTIASEATLYLRTEPVLLDNFIAELRALKSGKRDDANLQPGQLGRYASVEWVASLQMKCDYKEAQAAIADLKSGNVRRVEPAIQFLKADVYELRSGYLKEYLWRYLCRVPLTEHQIQRLVQVARKYLERRMTREFRAMCRLINQIASEEFVRHVRELTEDS